MPSLRSLVALAALLSAAACGDDGDSGDPAPDAATTPDDPDAAPDAPPPSTACADVAPGVHVETSVAANDDEPEPTGLTVDDGAPAALCGELAPAPGDAADFDLYRFTLAAAARLRVDIVAPDGGALSGFEARLYLESPDADPVLISGGYLVGDRLAFVTPNCANDVVCTEPEAPAGDYTLVVSPGFGPQVDEPAVRYDVTLSTYDADAACVTPDTVAFTEARDAEPDHDGNDVVVFGSWQLTAADDDAAEDSAAALTIAPAAYALAGATGAHAAVNGYHDVDTYEIVTGPDTRTLTIRLAWTGATGDLDWALLAPDDTAPRVLATAIGTEVPELQITAVEPSTTYWLWIGAYGAAEVPYQATICGAE